MKPLSVVLYLNFLPLIFQQLKWPLFIHIRRMSWVCTNSTKDVENEKTWDAREVGETKRKCIARSSKIFFITWKWRKIMLFRLLFTELGYFSTHCHYHRLFLCLFFLVSLPFFIHLFIIKLIFYFISERCRRRTRNRRTTGGVNRENMR